MRGQRLVPQMLRHLGDFPRRLAQHCAAAYDFTPCPPVGYPEVEGEVWCHRYYLRHLADEGRFPAWPLVEHVQLLQVRRRRSPSLLSLPMDLQPMAEARWQLEHAQDTLVFNALGGLTRGVLCRRRCWRPGAPSWRASRWG